MWGGGQGGPGAAPKSAPATCKQSEVYSKYNFMTIFLHLCLSCKLYFDHCSADIKMWA